MAITPVAGKILVKKINDEVKADAAGNIATAGNNDRPCSRAVIVKLSGIDADKEELLLEGNVVYYPYYGLEDIDSEYGILSVEHVLAVEDQYPGENMVETTATIEEWLANEVDENPKQEIAFSNPEEDNS